MTRTPDVPAKPTLDGLEEKWAGVWDAEGTYRFDRSKPRAEVYAIDTRTGRLRARIKVGQGPHGLCVWPQPGRLSLGHTGNMR